jgi:type IV secretory pathway VirB2 component (pilin)
VSRRYRSAGRTHRGGRLGTLVAALGAIFAGFALATGTEATFEFAVVFVVLAVLFGGAGFRRSRRRH